MVANVAVQADSGPERGGTWVADTIFATATISFLIAARDAASTVSSISADMTAEAGSGVHVVYQVLVPLSLA